MNQQKLTSRLFRLFTLVLALSMCCVIATPKVFAASGTIELTGSVPRYSINGDTENVVVQRGGSTFKIEVSAASADNYQLVDSIHAGTGQREVTFSRISGRSTYSPAITVTIPQNASQQLASITTKSGNITVQNSDNTTLLLNSITGNVKVGNVSANSLMTESLNGCTEIESTITKSMTTVTENGVVSVKFADSDKSYKLYIDTARTVSITVNGQSYTGGDYVINPTGSKNFFFDSGSGGTLVVSNLAMAVGASANVNANDMAAENILSQLQAPAVQHLSLNAISNSQYSQHYADNSDSIKELGIYADIVDVVFQNSLDNTFSAVLTVPHSSQEAYSDIEVRMEASGETLNIRTFYPDTNGFQGQFKYATLTVHVPNRQYHKLILDLTTTETQTNIPFRVSQLSIYKSAGDSKIDLQYPCTDVSIDNYYGTLDFYTPALGDTTLNNVQGFIKVHLPSEPDNMTLSLEAIKWGQYKIPNSWNTNANIVNDQDGGFKSLTYVVGAGSNTVTGTIDTGEIAFFVG